MVNRPRSAFLTESHRTQPDGIIWSGAAVISTCHTIIGFKGEIGSPPSSPPVKSNDTACCSNQQNIGVSKKSSRNGFAKSIGSKCALVCISNKHYLTNNIKPDKFGSCSVIDWSFSKFVTHRRENLEIQVFIAGHC